jgi:hypothetical protein
MKLTLTFLLLLFVFGKATFAQEESQNDLQVFDSFSAYSCEDLLSRLDGFVINGLGQNQNNKGYVVIYGADDSIKNKFLERYINHYRESRKIDKNRFVIIPTKAAPNFKIEFLLSKSGKTKPNVTEEVFPFVLTRYDKPVLFVRETVEVVKREGKWHYYGDCPACCIESYYSDFLSEYLKANPKLYARIKIYGRSKDHKEKLSSLIREELITEYEVSSNRFLIRIEGIDEGIAGLPQNLATIEIEFVAQK